MDILDKVKEYLDKGMEVSKEALSKAGDAVQDFSDKSVTRIEVRQLASRRSKEYRSLGQVVCQLFRDDPAASLAADDSRISGILQEIRRLDKEIERREESLRREAGPQAQDSGSPVADPADDDSPASGSTAADEKSSADDAEFTKSD